MLAADSRYPKATEGAAAALVRLLQTYEVGDDTWKNLTNGVLGELRAAHTDDGVPAAVWIVRRSLAGFRWELAFWIKETGGTTADPEAPTAAERATVAGSWDVNPLSAVPGVHPYIHLTAALRLLADRPQPEVAGPVEELLELWFAHAEHDKRGPHPRAVFLLESLVECYRVSRDAEGAGDATREAPAFLADLAGRRVSRPLKYRWHPGAARWFGFLTGRCNLSALAKRALR